MRLKQCEDGLSEANPSGADDKGLIALASSFRSVTTRLTFSAKMRVHPAAFNASTCAATEGRGPVPERRADHREE